MSESQSRYSIVERLTNKKLQLMDDKMNVASKIESKKQDIVMKESAMKTYEQAELEKTKAELAIQARDIVTDKAELDFLEKTKADKEKAYDLKIAELDKALQTLQDISENANKQAGE